MLGGAGHIADMVNRMKENQRMLQSRRELVRELRKMYLASNYTPTQHHLSPENIEDIKSTIRKEIKRKRQKARIITCCIMGVILILIVWMILKLPFQNFADTFL